MTTHDQETLTNSHDEPETAVEATPPQEGEPTTPVDSADPTAADPAAAPTPPAQDAGLQRPQDGEPTAPVDSADPTAADPAAAPTPPAQDAGVQREPSAEELLFANDDLADLRSRWAAVQASFVDDPKDCVQKADVLVSDLVEQLTSGFANARSRLEEQWARGEQASTEDLRVALMHYREFFERLLAV
jgi:hypothetical protein